VSLVSSLPDSTTNSWPKHPMVRLSDGWSLPLGLSAAPSPPC
jgi:hypothetical protein